MWLLPAIAPDPVDDPWPNTYGIWADELKAVGLEQLLEHRWSDTVSYFGEGGSTAQDQSHAHGIDYGLFDRAALQRHWLERAEGVVFHQDTVERVDVNGATTSVCCASGTTLQARLVIDASGSRTPHIRRPDQGPVAGQAAYGVVGRFSKPPIEPGRFVLMDYRCDHLSEEQRSEPPTFLYAMDLGDGVFFVEETSLALAPGVPYDVLKQRLQQRLDLRGVEITEVIHEEFCLFPMNLPLPDRNQPVLAFGGAASMVHPASGYMVGSLLRRGPDLAQAISRSHRQSKPWFSGLGATGLASAVADRIGAAPSALSIRFGPFDGLQRSVAAHPLRHLLFAAAGGVVWLPHQHPAVAALDGGDAAFVCPIPLGIAAGIGAGGGEGSSSAVLRSFQERPDPSVEGVLNIHASLI